MAIRKKCKNVKPGSGSDKPEVFVYDLRSMLGEPVFLYTRIGTFAGKLAHVDESAGFCVLVQADRRYYLRLSEVLGYLPSP